MKKSNTIEKVVAIGVGSAVYLVLARFLAIPTPIPNTSLQTSFAFLALISFVYGPFVGGAVGFIGLTLTDVISYGSPWFSWIIAASLFGFLVGLLGQKIGVKGFNTKKMVTFVIGQFIAAAISWGLVAPVLDILIYSEPANKVFTQGIVAGISNGVITAILGSLLLFAYSSSMVEKGSLDKE